MQQCLWDLCCQCDHMVVMCFWKWYKHTNYIKKMLVCLNKHNKWHLKESFQALRHLCEPDRKTKRTKNRKTEKYIKRCDILLSHLCLPSMFINTITKQPCSLLSGLDSNRGNPGLKGCCLQEVSKKIPFPKKHPKRWFVQICRNLSPSCGQS